MPLETYLTEGEEILAQAGNFYASNKRLIRYQKHFVGEELDDIPYSHITSIGIVRSRRRGFLKAGITITVIALTTLLTLVAITPILKSLSGILSTLMGFDLASLLAPLIPLSIILLVPGILLLASWFFLANNFIEFRAPGLSRGTEAKFRLGGVRKEANLNLMRIIRQHSLGAGKLETSHVPPSEDRTNQT